MSGFFNGGADPINPCGIKPFDRQPIAHGQGVDCGLYAVNAEACNDTRHRILRAARFERINDISDFHGCFNRAAKGSG